MAHDRGDVYQPVHRFPVAAESVALGHSLHHRARQLGPGATGGAETAGFMGKKTGEIGGNLEQVALWAENHKRSAGLE